MLTDCNKCKQGNDRATRQAMGCGYELPVENARAWSPPTGEHGYQYGDVTVCAGYLAALPEVVETGRAWLHWDHGQLESFAPNPPDALVAGIEVMDAEIAAARHWAETPESEGGGRK